MPYAREHIKPTKPSEYSNEESDDFYIDDFDELQIDDNGPELQSPAENSLYLPADDNSGTSASVSGPGGKNRFAPYAQQDYGLTGFLRDEFNLKLSAFKEYHREGYNLKGLDRDALRQVRERLNKPSSIVTQSEWRGTMSLVWEYLQKIARIEEPLETSPELQDALDQANKLTANMCTALDALDAVGTVGGKNWAEKVNEEASKQLDALTAEAIKRLNDNTALTLSDADYTKKKNELEGLLSSESYLLHAENYKFGKYKKSLLAEERFMRIRLAAYLDSTAEQILNGARDSRKYALRYLHLQRPQTVPEGSSGRTETGPYNRFRAVDDGGLTIPALSEEPRMGSFRPEKPVEPLPVRVSRTILPVTSALMEMAAALRQQGANLMPPEEESPEVYRDEVVAFFKEAPEKQLHRIKNMYHTARVAVSGLEKKVWETLPGLGYQPDVYSPVYKHTVNDAALLLLDELYQTERQLRLLPATAWALQESVEQYQSVTSQQPGRMFAEPVLNALLDEQLKQEAARWHGKIKQSEDKLTMLLAPVTRFARETGSEAFWYDLWDELRKRNGGEGEWQGTAQFNDLMTRVVEKLSGIAREIEASALRLARHGHEGGKDLNKKIQQWLRDVSLLKKRVKVGVVRITGKAPGYYSREGMLARGMAEWAEELKQDYLQETNPDDQEAAATVFEQNLIRIVKDNRQHFRTEDDPWARQLLQHLKLALKHAAQNTMTYPPTPEDILAGARTVPDDIKRWAQKKVVSGAISAAIRQGFKVVSSPASLPGRLVLRSARTGIALYRGIKAINKGVKFGEGPATQREAQFTRNQLFRAGFRLTMSLSPLAAWGVSAAITVERLYGEDKYGKKFVTEALNDLPEDLLWRGGYAGISNVFQTLLSQAIQQSEVQENQQLGVEESRLIETEDVNLSRGSETLMTDELEPGISLHPNGDSNQNEFDESKGHHSIRQRSVQSNEDSVADDSLLLSTNYRQRYANIKNQTYYNAIRYKLNQIASSETYSDNIRDNAHLASIGAPLLMPVLIHGVPLTDVFFLPIPEGGNAGLIVDLTSNKPGYWIDNPSGLRPETKNRIPFYGFINGQQDKDQYGRTIHLPSTAQYFDLLRSGHFITSLNEGHTESMSLIQLTEKLVEIERGDISAQLDKSKKGFVDNAILGSQLPEADVSAIQVPYKLETTWENLSGEAYLRSIARPFSELSGQVQLIISDSEGETIQQTEKSVQKAIYIGTWVDVSVGAIISFTPQGWVLNTVQSAADIGADIAAGKEPNYLAVAGLILGCIPGEKVAAKIGRFSEIAGKSVKYSLMLGNKTIDLAIVGTSVKTAVESGEPLAIYQAFLASGMSVKNSYDMTNSMSSRLGISKKMEESASLEKLTATSKSNNNIYEYNFSSQMPEADGAVLNKNSQKGKELSGVRLSMPKATLAENSVIITGRTYDDPIVYASGPVGESRYIYENVFEILSKDTYLKSLAQKPEGHCANAAMIVNEKLQLNGYTTKTIGCQIYQKFNEGNPLNHYAILAEKNGRQLVVDITFDQFTEHMYRRGEFTITSYEEWKEKLASSDKLKNRLVIAKVYPTFASATNELLIPDESEFIESEFVDDSNVSILHMPDSFVKKLHASYLSDIASIKMAEGTNVEKELSETEVKLQKAKMKAWETYVDKGKTVPPVLEDKISKLKSKTDKLKRLHGAPKRISNYHSLSSSKLTTPEFEKYRVTHDGSINSNSAVNLPIFIGKPESSLDNPNRFYLPDAEIKEAKDSLLKDLLSTPAAEAQMDRITKYPAGHCDTAAKKVLELLQGKGYKTSIIGVLNYQSLSDVTPMDHYVVLATKNDKSLVIDSTFSQYLASHKREWVITSLEEWQKKLVNADNLKNKLVIIKEYGSIQQAYNDIHLPDPKPWLQSKYSNDAQFKPIQIPGFMVKHMKAEFNSDIELMNSKNGLERISMANSDITVEIKNLRKLRVKENSYIQKDKNVPDKIASKIQSTERKIAELKKIHDLPDRVNNFLLLTKHNPELRVAGVGLSSSAYDKLASSPLAQRITNYRELSLQEHKSATPGNGYDVSANQGQIEYPGPSTSNNLSFDKLTDHKISINKPNRMILSRYFAGNRVESFDYNKSKFEKDDSFTISRAEMASTSDVSVVRSEALKDSVTDMENKTKTLRRHLQNYSGSDKQAVRDNLDIVTVALEEIKEDLNSPNADSDDSIYVLTKKNADPNAVTNHFGLATFSYKHSSSNIKLNFLTAHPYVILNKYPGFRNYLYRNKLIKTSDLLGYNIKNIARFLGIKAARREIQFMESIPELRVETFSFHGANPITQKLGYQLERMSGLFSGHKPSETVVDDSVQIANTSPLQDEDKYFTEQIDYLRSTARNSFRPVEPIQTLSDAQTQSAVNELLHTYNGEIMSHNVSESISSDDIEIKDFSAKVISSAEKAFDKVSVVKKLFDSAKSNPEIKNSLKSRVDEAVGLNDEVLVDIDKVDVSSVSDMAYDRFKENIDKTYNYLAQKKADGFNNISLIKYRKLDASSPQAFALPYDPKKRILVAIQSDNLSHDNLADTVVHEASHNAAYTLDHTYLGNVQAESGSFPDSFQLASRDTRYFSDNDLTITNSTNYALGLPATHRPTQEQQMHAQILLQNSRVIKADTLLNAAEYNAYMIHVFNRARINDSGTDIYFTESRRTRQTSEVDDDFDRMIMRSLLKASGNYHSFDELPDNDAGVESDIHLFASNPSQNVPSITMPARSADISVPESERVTNPNPGVHIPKTVHNPASLGDYAYPGDIYSVRGDYWMIRCEGWPSESEWPMPSEGGTNDYWTYIGKHTGTREDPKVWTEYGFPGDFYREHGNVWKFKSEGRPSEQQLYYSTIEEPDDPYWQHLELIAGTWDNPKTWSDYGFPGDIYKEGEVYWRFKSRGFPQKRYWYYPAEETSDEHWTYLSKHSGTIDDPKTLSDQHITTSNRDVVYDKIGTIEFPRFWGEYGIAGDVFYDEIQDRHFILKTEGNPEDKNWYFPDYGDDTNEHWSSMWEGPNGELLEEF